MKSDDTSEALSDAAHRVLSASVSSRRTVQAEAEGIDWNAWHVLVDLGLTSSDAAQLGLREQAAVLRAIGYGAALVPYAESECIARWFANAAGIETRPDEVLSIMIADRARAELDADHSSGFLLPEGAHVKWSGHADRVLVAFSEGDEHYVSAVERAELEFERTRNLAGEPYDTCTSARVPMSFIRAVAPCHGARAVSTRGAFCRIAEMCGAVQRVNELTLQYAADRRQFGRPISQYQVIQSYLAEMAAEESAATAMFEVAIDALTDDPEEGCIELAAARVRMGQTAQLICRLAHQIHGAIGFTQEYPLHLWTRRLWAWREEYGNEIEWARRLGESMISLGPSTYWERITS